MIPPLSLVIDRWDSTWSVMICSESREQIEESLERTVTECFSGRWRCVQVNLGTWGQPSKAGELKK